MSKLLVTGGTGFVGGVLVRSLIRRGYSVRIMSRRPASSAALRLESIGAEVVAGDLLESSMLPRVINGCDGLFHLAAMFEIGSRNRPEMYAVNVEGTESLFSASRVAGIDKIIHVSTVLALGPTSTGCVPASLKSEDLLESPPRDEFTGPFEETKHLAQRIALLHAKQGARIVIVCPGTVLGIGDPSEIGTALNLNMRGRLPFLTGGSSCFSFVGLHDAVEGLILAYEKGIPGKIYPLVSEVLSLEELSHLASSAAGVAPTRWDMPRWITWTGLPLVNLIARFSGGRRIYSREALSILACDWGYDASISHEELGWDCLPISEVLSKLAASLSGE